ncbi:MAG: SRPBCC family protein [Candidatus Dormibacteraeota bacterium]|nr:SRPBCC family protein [Candidatus Dormibacteraeota bacterium]
MGAITIHETVDATVETVFAYVDDYRNTTKYMVGLTKWKPTTDVTHGKGAKFEVAMKAGPATLGSIVDISLWSENKAIGWHSVEGFKQKGQWAFRRAGDGTDVTFTMEYELPGGIAGRMLSRAADPVVRSNLQRSVKQLKQHTEKLKPARPTKTTAKPAAKAAAKRGTGGRAAKR